MKDIKIRFATVRILEENREKKIFFWVVIFVQFDIKNSGKINLYKNKKLLKPIGQDKIFASSIINKQSNPKYK